jgi:hypothetical protein
MAGPRKWRVEAKEFELLIKGGADGVRIFERNGKKQRSIFLLKIELAWLVRIMEELVAMENSKVFWDQSRAGYTRIIAQKCSNRHGRFLTIEEFDGKRRCGSLMIPEGRYGQGWDRFMVEVRRANSSFQVVREVREYAKVTGRRSFAEVVGLPQNSADECFNTFSEPIARIPLWLKDASAEMEAQKCKNIVLAKKTGELVKEDESFVSAGAEDTRRIPACRLISLANSLVPVVLSHPSKPVERLKGHEESDGYGQSILSTRLELLAFKSLLTKIRGEVDEGLERLEAILLTLEISGPSVGLSEKQIQGLKEKQKNSVEAPIGSRLNGHKQKNKKKKKKPKGREIGKGPGAGSQGIGETPLAGAAYGASAAGLAAPSILDRFEWARKDCQERVAAVGVGSSSMVAGELKKMSGAAVQLAPTRAPPSQTAPTAGEDWVTGVPPARPLAQTTSTASLHAQTTPTIRLPSPTVTGGGMGFSVEHGVPPARPFLCPGGIIDPLGVSAGAQLYASKSWVAGRTGFGPVDSGRAVGLSKPGGVIKVGENSSAPVAAPQSEQGISMGTGGPDETDSVSGLEESYVEDTLDKSGHDVQSLGSMGESPPVLILNRKAAVMNAEVEVSPTIMRNLKRAGEVGNIIGLTCGGQEGLKMDCLKQVVMENYGKGGGSFGSTVQQEGERLDRERGNCSGYEA